MAADPEALGVEKQGVSRAGMAGRVVAITVVYALIAGGLGLLTGPRPGLTAAYLEAVVGYLVTGAVYALVLLPLARRLPYRMGTRFLAVFMPLYWIGILSNLVEAAFDTSLPKGELVAAAIVEGIPCAVVAVMVAWLLPATGARGKASGIRETLGQRSPLSWAWRTAIAGLLFAGFLELFGLAWGPLIAKYYHNPAFISQAHTITPPNSVAGPEEVGRGILFVLSLLAVLAVMRGRDWLALIRTGAYIALIDAAFEAWLPMLSNTSFPLGFRIGEALDLTTDAIVRGVIVAVLLALPATAYASPEAEPAVGVPRGGR
jgi:hypothetical protein